MLPVMLYNNMEEMPNHLNTNPNTSFGLSFDESVILNSVRNRKKVTELPSCPICSCTIRQGELESHLALEIEKLQKISTVGSKRKLSSSAGASTSQAVPSSSSSVSNLDDESNIDFSGCTGGDVYRRVHINRVKRLRSWTRRLSETGKCPVCDSVFPVSKLQKHALRCLKKTGANIDEDISSSDESSIDVENDPPSGFGAEYEWCGEWRVRATALQERPGLLPAAARRCSDDGALVVDGDDDTEMFGPPQYSPSRVALDAAVEESPVNGTSQSEPDEFKDDYKKTPSDIVEASAETRIQALKSRIRELEEKADSKTEAKCLICLDPFTSPVVSIQCWHVYCEECWLQSLRAKKICPQCNAITITEHLRRIYM